MHRERPGESNSPAMPRYGGCLPPIDLPGDLRMTAFDDIFKSLRTERGVNRQSVVSAIESALLAAFSSGSDAPSAAYSRAVFDSETGEMRIERLRDLHAGDLPRPGIDVVDDRSPAAEAEGVPPPPGVRVMMPTVTGRQESFRTRAAGRSSR